MQRNPQGRKYELLRMPSGLTEDQHAGPSLVFLFTSNIQLETEKGISFERAMEINKVPRKELHNAVKETEAL